ncbi:MAG: cell division protein ZapA [Candidatus Schekmanbacteria bacterium]|nr:cell division protein ZapA [Candidatus Schekmanbacteria bacterium]
MAVEGPQLTAPERSHVRAQRQPRQGDTPRLSLPSSESRPTTSGGSRVRVRIFSQEFVVRGNTEPEVVRKVAEYVDGKMREANQATPRLSTERVAILAAMKIAGELMQLRGAHQQLQSDIADAVRRVEEILEQQLEGQEE